MSVLLPWPSPLYASANQCPPHQDKLVTTETAFAPNVGEILDLIETDLAKMRPVKKRLQSILEKTIRSSTLPSLQGCHLEVVGSSSWGGDVPQSDLDLLLMTPDGGAAGQRAINILRDLHDSLTAWAWLSPWGWSSQLGPCAWARQGAEQVPWHRLELLETAFVPVLRLHCANEFHCDVCVDQHHSIAHRSLLQQAVADRPTSLDLVKLIKCCLYRRGLPMAAEGGLPSVAWSLIAMSWAQEQPLNTPIEALFRGFLEEMQRLVDCAFSLRWFTKQTDNGCGVKCGYLEWRDRGGSQKTFADDWIQLISVEDPVPRVHAADEPSICLHSASITPPSIPAALGLLYIIEFRLALNALRDSNWRELWRNSQQPRPLLNRMAADSGLHVFLSHGEVCVGRVRSVRFCPGLKRGGILHHRDQSCQIQLQEVQLKNCQLKCAVCSKDSKDRLRVWCQPCNWVCMLPVGSKGCLSTAGLFRLLEIVQVVGITRVSRNVCEEILTWRNSFVHRQIRIREAVPDLTEDSHQQLDPCISAVQEGQPSDSPHANLGFMPVEKQESSMDLEDVSTRASVNSEKHEATMDLEDESERASDTECEPPKASNLIFKKSIAAVADEKFADVPPGSAEVAWRPALRHIVPVAKANVPDAKPSQEHVRHVTGETVSSQKPLSRCCEAEQWRPTLRHTRLR